MMPRHNGKNLAKTPDHPTNIGFNEQFRLGTGSPSATWPLRIPRIWVGKIATMDATNIVRVEKLGASRQVVAMYPTKQLSSNQHPKCWP